jgi:hypothetical protein
MALRNTTLIFSLVVGASGVVLVLFDPYWDLAPILFHTISRITLLALFCIQNALVNLLFTQHWSFLSSAQSSQEAAVWFAPIAGLGSIASTAAALAVQPLVKIVGLTPLLIAASALLLVCAYLGDDAYRIAHEVRMCSNMLYICIAGPSLSLWLRLVLSNRMALHPNQLVIRASVENMIMQKVSIYAPAGHFYNDDQFSVLYVLKF